MATQGHTASGDEITPDPRTLTGTAIAVAVNPQTIPMDYELQTDLVRALCLGGLDDETIRRRFADRAHMPDAWAPRPNLRAIVVQNVLDEHHYERHFKPFWTALGGTIRSGWSSAGRSLACLYEHPDGHIAETYEMTAEIIDRIRHMLEPDNAGIALVNPPAHP